MNVPALAIRHRTSVLVLTVLLVVGGAAAYALLPKESTPSIEIPFVVVTTVWPGASPQDVEDQVTTPLEQEIQGAEGIAEIRSTSRLGVSSVVVEFAPSVNTSDANQRVRERVSTAQTELPAGAEEPLVNEIDTSEFPILTINLVGDYPLSELKQVAEDLQDEIEAVPGVLEADLTGGLTREVQVNVDPVALEGYGLSFQQLIETIQTENTNLPGGSIDVDRRRYTVRVEGAFAAPRVIGDLVVALPEGAATPVYVRDVAEVTFGFEERASYARVKVLRRKGDEFLLEEPPVEPDALYEVENPEYRPTVSLGVQKRAGQNILETLAAVEGVVEDFPFPEGTDIVLTGDQGEEVRTLLSDLQNELISGVLLVTLVLVLFFGVRTAVLIASVIPLSLLTGFLVFGGMQLTLNFIVLFSLIVALGMLVDFGLIVVENVYRYREEGYGRWEAAREASGEIGGAVTAGALTTVAAFVPMLFWTGQTGEFLRFIPLTLIIVLLSALFVGLVIAPVVAGLFVRPEEGGEAKRERGDREENGEPASDGGGDEPEGKEKEGEEEDGRRELTPWGRRVALAGLAAAVLALVLVNPLSALVLAALAAALWALYRFVLEPASGWFRETALPWGIGRYRDFLGAAFERDYDAPHALLRNAGALGALVLGLVLLALGAAVRFALGSVAGWIFLGPGGLLAALGLLGVLALGLETLALGRWISVKAGLALGAVAAFFAAWLAIGGTLPLAQAALLLLPAALVVGTGLVGVLALGDRDRLVLTDNRARVLTVAIGGFLSALGLFALVGPGQAFFPETDPNQVSVTIEAPLGTNLQGTNRLTERAQDRIDRLLADDADARASVKNVLAQVGVAPSGQGTFGGGEEPRPERARITINFISFAERAESSAATLGKIREAFEGFLGAEITIQESQLGPPTGPPVNVEVTGEDYGRVQGIALDLKRRLQRAAERGEIPGLVDVGTDVDQGRPEYAVRIDRERAARFGLSTDQIARVVRTAVAGTTADTYREGEDEYDIVVQLEEESRRDLESLRTLTIPTPRTGSGQAERVPLVAVADLVPTDGPGAIRRLDLEPLVTVEGDAAPGFSDNDVLAGARRVVNAYDLPPGYEVSFTGQAEEQQDSFQFLLIALVAALALISLVLVAKFDSVTITLTVLLAVGLTFSGVVLGLVFTATPFSLFAFLGLITLAGIVVDDDIVLHEFANAEMAEGASERDAYLEAGTTRFRQVVVTAVTTIVGLIPLTFGINIDFVGLVTELEPSFHVGSENSQFWGSMGTAIIAGLPIALVVTLGIAPVMRSALDSVEGFLTRTLTRPAEDEEPQEDVPPADPPPADPPRVDPNPS
jgi:multidrug efflux pump subunit AcrB